jgi:hypothetical protein
MPMQLTRPAYLSTPLYVKLSTRRAIVMKPRQLLQAHVAWVCLIQTSAQHPELRARAVSVVATLIISHLVTSHQCPPCCQQCDTVPHTHTAKHRPTAAGSGVQQ